MQAAVRLLPANESARAALSDGSNTFFVIFGLAKARLLCEFVGEMGLHALQEAFAHRGAS
jgi:hypothetical protein